MPSLSFWDFVPTPNQTEDSFWKWPTFFHAAGARPPDGGQAHGSARRKFAVAMLVSGFEWFVQAFFQMGFGMDSHALAAVPDHARQDRESFAKRRQICLLPDRRLLH